MKTGIWLSMIGLAFVTAVAGTLPRERVAADAMWVVHLDLEQLKQTTVGNHLLDEMDQPENQRKLEAFEAVFNFDPRKDVRSLTLYGPSAKPTEAVLFMSGRFDADRLVTLARGAKDYQSTQHGKHTIHHWIDEKQSAKKGANVRTYAAMHGTDTVIFAQSADAVSGALEVLDDRRPDLASSATFQDLNAPNAGFLQAATRLIEVPDNGPHSALLRQVRYLSLTGGERAEQLSMRLRLDTAAPQTAEKVEQIARGLIAMMSLQTNNPDAVKFANALDLKRQDNRLDVTLELPADEVIDGMKKRSGAQR